MNSVHIVQRLTAIVLSLFTLLMPLRLSAQDGTVEPQPAQPPLPLAALSAPVNVVPSETVATYTAGAFLEGMAFDPDGNLYVTTTNLETESAAILKVTPDGTISVLTDVLGGFGGVMVYFDDALYMTSNTPENPEGHGVWRITLGGTAELWVTLPPDAQPNGITVLSDDALLVADSGLGALYTVDVESRDYSVWLSAPETLGPDGGFYPGANGVQVYESDVYVAVPDRLSIVRIPMLDDGSAGEPVIHAEGIAGDDFAIDIEGNLYVTTHPFNTVVRVDPEGEMVVIATAEQNVVGATAAVFGRLPEDASNLYVIGDGGVFEVLLGLREAPLEPHIVRLEIGVAGYTRP